MKNLLLLISVACLLVFTSCSKEPALKKSIFIADPEYPDLPQYSEWGYNTFGAYYDRAAFISNDIDVPMKVVVTNDTTSFIFSGQIENSDNSTGKMSMKVCLANYLPHAYTDLISLNKTTIDLKDTNCTVSITIDDTFYKANILNGTLEFHRAQNLFVDNQQVEVILSGYFDFQAIINNVPISLTDGRFDVGIGTNNFFYY